MREIKINRLTLENFKCHDRLDLMLDGRSVSIYGDNATGKTSIYDALTWLLFGKDSLGNGEKNIDIKPLDAQGDVKDHQAITSVEAEFQVDGQIQTFKRTYREVWATRRGSANPVYEGNTSDYFANGVPCRKNAYDAAIRELVSEDLFRMLTSVSHFAAGMKWQERRAVLFDMAGTLTDREILGREAKFAALLESLGSLTLPEYKAKLQHQKKGLTGVRDDAPTRINECQRTLADMEGMDFDKAREEEQELSKRRDGLKAQLIALDMDSVLEQKRLQLREAKLERDTLESRNRIHREQQRSTGRDQTILINELAREKGSLEQCRNYRKGISASIARYDNEIQKSRDQYVQVNGEAFAGGKCPACGQALPFDQLRFATAEFDRKKKDRLNAIIETAHRLQDEQEEAGKRRDAMDEEIRQREQRVKELEDQLEASKTEKTEIRDLPEYKAAIADINATIEQLQGQISDLKADTAKVMDQLRFDLSETEGKLRAVQAQIAKEAIRDQTLKRIAELKDDARNAAEALESIDRMLFLMEEFTRFKARFVEESINDHFRIASFRLFREQANGGLEERCDAQQDGVPFTGLNNGMKVNVGIDIINALSRHYGVTVPLFVDNAEAVTRLEPCRAQVIRLVVSENDKELRIV